MAHSTPSVYNQKKELLQDMLDRLVNWDQAADTAQDVLNLNQESIEEIIELDKKLTGEELEVFTDSYRSLIEQVISVQQHVVDTIKKETDLLSKQMKQVNKRDKVVSHYMDKEESLFVDREV